MNFHRSWFDPLLNDRFALHQFELCARSPSRLLRKMHAAARRKHRARFHRIITPTARTSFYNATQSFHRCKDRREDFAGAGMVRGGLASPARIGRKITNVFWTAERLIMA